MTNIVYLVRHGENPANISHVFSNNKIDLPLTPRGRLQAQQTAEYFKSKSIDEIFASPLKRAVETASIIGEGPHLPVKVVEDFRELNVGDLEETDDLTEAWRIHDRIFLDWLSGNRNSRFPGGEDGHTAVRRFQRGLVEVLQGKRNRKIIIVGHGGLFYTGITSVCPDVDIEELLKLGYDNCSIVELELDLVEGIPHGSLIRWGDRNHLHGEAANFAFGHP